MYICSLALLHVMCLLRVRKKNVDRSHICVVVIYIYFADVNATVRYLCVCKVLFLSLSLSISMYWLFYTPHRMTDYSINYCCVVVFVVIFFHFIWCCSCRWIYEYEYRKWNGLNTQLSKECYILVVYMYLYICYCWYILTSRESLCVVIKKYLIHSFSVQL